MKKQFTILFLISILNIIDAQPQKGSFFIGAKVGVFNIIQKKDKEENIGYFILPSLGYMITNKIGLSLDFKYYKNDYTIYYPTNPPTSSDFPISYKTENYNTNYQIGISTHFYIPIIKKHFLLFYQPFFLSKMWVIVQYILGILTNGQIPIFCRDKKRTHLLITFLTLVFLLVYYIL